MMRDQAELEALMERAREGDRDSLVALLERLGPRIRDRIEGRISAGLRSVLDADDVMQVTYLEAVLQFDRFREGGVRGFLAWMRRLAENNLTDAVRGLEAAKRPNPGRRVGPAQRGDSALLLVEYLGATYTTPSRQAARQEACAFVERALGRLPAAYATVIRLHDLEGRPMAEVAQEMGRSEGAAYMLRARALDRLRGVLGTESRFFTRRA